MQKSATEPDRETVGNVEAARAAQARRFQLRPSRRTLSILAIALLGPLVAAIAGGYYYFASGRYVATDNAYVKAHKIAVSADVAGRVSEVYVDADQVVQQGTLLFRLDPQPFRIALDRAEAQLAAATQEAQSLRSLYDQKVARLKLAEGDLTFHQQHFDRQDSLTKTGVVSRSGMDLAERGLRNARDQIVIAHQEIAEVQARLGGDPARPPEQQPSVREARAVRDRAAWDLERTEIRAPVAGVVTNFDLQPGTYVTAGSVVFSMVGSENIWVQANFKETDLTNVKIGQRATIHVDMYPGRAFRGSVSSISAATGAEFALLPPQNATGNWVKVVQRLPVRLRIDAEDAPTLRSGMSVVVSIDTEHRRAVPKWAMSFLGWADVVSAEEAARPGTKQ
ncbi:HlyD family secretion protein [Hyphomicrobium sp. CS1BSMeth3]|uniref:HlyD family secretion protein n=1 Tax=Hyphomicrobium sp. CS1BSMeth3 TaxID=1892844 RepID=UPI0009304A2F|nr:HlyD family secretion protein [Hyphomicrobium sp. CS1BSMeth3]